jgi:hypothetical protein
MNGTPVTATLEDNETSRAFVALLPLTLTLEDYNGTEKIHVVIQALVPGTLAVIDTAMIYLTLHHLHQLVASQSASGGAGCDALIAVAERYDPHHEALVSVAIGRRHPVTIVMELDHPVVPIQVSGVH